MTWNLLTRRMMHKIKNQTICMPPTQQQLALQLRVNFPLDGTSSPTVSYLSGCLCLLQYAAKVPMYRVCKANCPRPCRRCLQHNKFKLEGDLTGIATEVGLPCRTVLHLRLATACSAHQQNLPERKSASERALVSRHSQPAKARR